MLLYSPLKFSICDIYHMFCAVLVDLFYTKFICILCKFYPVRSFDYRWNNKYESWNNIGSSTLNRHNSFNVVSTLFCQRWNNVDKHTSAQLSFSTKFQCWNNVGSSTLNRRNSINIVSTLFCQRWNNVDKYTSAQLSFSTKFQRWNNIGSSTLNRPNSIDVV